MVVFSKKSIILILIFTFLFSGFSSIANDSELLAAEGCLSLGSRGDMVVEVQNVLNNNGYWCGAADGIYGTKTYNAVKSFQKNVGIKVDGIVGPETRKYLGISNPSQNYTPSRGTRVMTMVSTGYCPCAKCSWPYADNLCYMGYPAGRGIVAVDPKVIPMGTRVYVEGYGAGLAADQGGAIKGNRIDLCFNSHQEALNWGIKTVKVTVY